VVGRAGGWSDGLGVRMSGRPDGRIMICDAGMGGGSNCQSIEMGCWNGLGVCDDYGVSERGDVQCNG
jgi:hypothetical protein